MGNCVTSSHANFSSSSSGTTHLGGGGGGGGLAAAIIVPTTITPITMSVEDTNTIEHHNRHHHPPMVMTGNDYDDGDDDDDDGSMGLSSDFKVNLMVLLAVSKLQRAARRKKAYKALQLHQQWKLFSDLDTQDEAEMLNLAVFMQTLIEAIPPEITPKSSSTKESKINNFFGNSEFDGLGTIQLLSVDVSSKRFETLPPGPPSPSSPTSSSTSSSSASSSSFYNPSFYHPSFYHHRHYQHYHHHHHH